MMTDALTAMFDWQMPVALHFGAGVLETLPARLDGDRVVLLTFAGAEACGLLSRLRGLLGDQLLHVELVPEGLAELSRLEPLAARLWPIMARTYESMATIADDWAAIGSPSAPILVVPTGWKMVVAMSPASRASSSSL